MTQPLAQDGTEATRFRPVRRRRYRMKCVLILVLMMQVVSASADELIAGSSKNEVIHVATALDHLTVLEFGEPVTMAAAGSPAFQIERHEDKVFIKPLKSGASTDLFVWTASRRFAYELEAPGEVKNMNFAVDSVISTPKPVPDSSARLDEVADMMLTRASLGAERIDSTSIGEEKGRITIRIEQVLQSKNSFYIHYSVRNHSARPYRVTTPTITEVLAPQATISILSLRRTQLDKPVLHKLGELRERPLTPARVEIQKEDLQPGDETQGVVVIREQVSSPTVFQLTFGPEGSHRVQGTLVF